MNCFHRGLSGTAIAQIGQFQINKDDANEMQKHSHKKPRSVLSLKHQSTSLSMLNMLNSQWGVIAQPNSAPRQYSALHIPVVELGPKHSVCITVSNLVGKNHRSIYRIIESFLQEKTLKIIKHNQFALPAEVTQSINAVKKQRINTHSPQNVKKKQDVTANASGLLCSAY